MSDIKEQSRPSKGGMRLEQYSSNLAPALTQTKDLTKIPADTTEIIEHPRLKEDLEVNDRARHYIRHWAFLVSGIIIGAALIVFLRLNASVNELKDPPQVASTSIKIAAVDRASTGAATEVKAISPDPATQPVSKEASQASVSAEPEPSNIIEHARSREVTLQERRFLFSSNSARTYDTDYQAGDVSAQNSAPQALTLKPIDDVTGRYRVNGTNIDWQGSWQPFNPEHNLRIGGAYNDYLNRTFGNTVGKNLSAINKEPSSLLGSVGRPQVSPGSIKQ